MNEVLTATKRLDRLLAERRQNITLQREMENNVEAKLAGDNVLPSFLVHSSDGVNLCLCPFFHRLAKRRNMSTSIIKRNRIAVSSNAATKSGQRPQTASGTTARGYCK